MNRRADELLDIDLDEVMALMAGAGKRPRARNGQAAPIENLTPPVAPVIKVTRAPEKSDFQTAPVFQREDWTLFRNIPGLSQRAGVKPDHLAQIVGKELADNALDASGAARVGWLDEYDTGRGFYVEDDGVIPGSDDEIAELFSIRRPLRSTKLERLPTRGALGNGLRVVAGAVLASGGSLVVATGGRRLRLEPQDDGSTKATRLGKHSGGTRVEVVLGPALASPNALKMAEDAIEFAGDEKIYSGLTSPHWYDPSAFFELCQAFGGSARELVSRFDGCTGAKAGRIAKELGLQNAQARALDRGQAGKLLEALRAASKPVNPKRLAPVGRETRDRVRSEGYAIVRGHFNVGGARLPYIVEAWADVEQSGEPSVWLYVNRTRTVSQTGEWIVKGKMRVHECGINVTIDVGRAVPNVDLCVTTPFMPITSDGKEPNLAPLRNPIAECIGRAVRSAKKNTSSGAGGKRSEKDVYFANMARAVATVGGSGRFKFQPRNLFYEHRPKMIAAFDKEPTYSNFAKVLTEYEAEHGEIPNLYRDDRGVIYHPHTGELIPLGTRSVAAYEQPAWTFNKVLFVEKEGHFEMLRELEWPERHDCVLLTSKGQPTRAARDLLDLIGDGDEEILFFCAHDADAAGTIIYQSLQEETDARPKRRVKIVNLGLEPQEALAMGLQIETVHRKGEKQPAIARYVSPEDREWLLHNRIELNAMTPAKFVEWLDRKMAEHGHGKLVPPREVLGVELRNNAERITRREITERILREAKLDEQVTKEMQRLESRIKSTTSKLDKAVRADLAKEPAQSWRAPVERIAGELSKRGKKC